MEVSTPEELGTANCPTKKQKKRAGTPKYADGGYGWVVLASCFTITGLTSSFVRAFGIFFLDIQNCFDTLAFKVSWISAITVTVFHLSSPLASILNLKLSHRVIAMIGGIFSMLGLFLGSFAFSLSWMYFTVGFLLGLVVDWTKDYSTAFLLAGGGMLIASSFLIPVDYLLTCGQHSVQGSEKEMEGFKSQDQSQKEAEKMKVDNDRMEDLEPMSE